MTLEHTRPSTELDTIEEGSAISWQITSAELLQAIWKRSNKC